jgi:hypothetical protein
VIAVHPVPEGLVEQFNVFFQANSLAHLVEMLFAHLLPEFGIMQQQVRQLRSLLYQVQLGHALRFSFKFRGRNAHQFAQYIPGIVERQGLIEVAGKQVPLQWFVTHMAIRFIRGSEWPINNIDSKHYQSDNGTGT